MRVLYVLAAIGLLLSGCLPDVSDECGPAQPCASGQCVAGVCVPRAADARPDAAPHDLGALDGALPDAATPDQGAPCVPTSERCNGIDDDCDDRVDEGPGGVLSRPCYPADAMTQGVGQCVEGRSTCRDGAFAACEAARGPLTEFCNGLDDDCDGVSDETTLEGCYGGPAGTAGVGRCRAGRRRCVAAVASPECLDEVRPAVEVCDGVDGDCDGAIDEGLDCACADAAQRPCYAGPPATEGVGRCAGGTQTCVGALWGACRDAVGPTGERCNGIDDDCDGLTDEGLGGAACRVGDGICAAEGLLRCTAEGLRCDAPAVPPERERCNGLDDDCDGRTDEGYRRGAPCQTGVGPCAAEGFIECAADGLAVCRADPLLPGAEACNAVDDDCDGRVDEGATVRCYPGPSSTRDQGVCRAGEQSCVNGAASGACRGAVLPAEELCDGRDRDCDGVVDEQPERICRCAPGEERACYAGPAGSAGRGRCRAGQQRCAGGTFGACLDEVLPAAETCDGSDEDCDGRVDENTSDVGRPCVRGVGACAVEGRRACVDGGTVCDATPGAPSDEICNGVDDDCDGVIDEGIRGVGEPCRVGQGICASDGLTACRAAEGVVCAGEPRPPMAEQCNALDDDCDGAVDEGVRNACGICGPPPPADTCDGIDTDCDGVVDEAPDLLVGTRCASGEGVCAREGRYACRPGGLVCASEAPVGAPEACNGADDDCDGLIDEAAPCDLAYAAGRCDAGACAVDGCLPGAVDDDGLHENGCERGCQGVDAPQRLGMATAIGLAHVADQTAIGWTDGDVALLAVDGADPIRLALAAPLERPQPHFDGDRWSIIGRMRLDGRQRAVRLDYAAGRIEVLPGLDAGPPDGRFDGARSVVVWLARAAADDASRRLFVSVGGAAPRVIPLAADPHPTAGPAIVGTIDDALRVAVPVGAGDAAAIEIWRVDAAGAVREGAIPTVGPVVGRLAVARSGRAAVVGHAGAGGLQRIAVTFADDGVALEQRAPLRPEAGVGAVGLARAAGGLLAVSVASQADPPCVLHLLRRDGSALAESHPAPACSALAVTRSPAGPVLAWIDADGIAWRARSGCR